MKNVIIAGATGMIGGLVLDHCLKSPEIGKVTIIVRKPKGISDSKLTEVVHSDFNNYSAVEEHFNNQDIAYYCIGVYTDAVPRNEFREITVDFTKAFADTLKQNSPEATLCFLSGMGADRTEKSRAMFAIDKGIAENYLLKQDFNQLYMFRPAYIYPITPRKEPNLSYRIMRAAYPIFNIIYPNGSLTSVELASAMFRCGLHGWTEDTLENRDIKKAAAMNYPAASYGVSTAVIPEVC